LENHQINLETFSKKVLTRL